MLAERYSMTWEQFLDFPYATMKRLEPIISERVFEDLKFKASLAGREIRPRVIAPQKKATMEEKAKAANHLRKLVGEIRKSSQHGSK